MFGPKNEKQWEAKIDYAVKKLALKQDQEFTTFEGEMEMASKKFIEAIESEKKTYAAVMSSEELVKKIIEIANYFKKDLVTLNTLLKQKDIAKNSENARNKKQAERQVKILNKKVEYQEYKIAQEAIKNLNNYIILLDGKVKEADVLSKASTNYIKGSKNILKKVNKVVKAYEKNATKAFNVEKTEVKLEQNNNS